MTDAHGQAAERERNFAARPRLICVGTGRDGTQSLCQMIHELFDRTDGRTVMHEYCCREFYQAFCGYRETDDARYLDKIRRMIVECPHDAIVGNGYAAILPLFRELWGPETKLLHLKRADRGACLDSLLKNAELAPTAYRYYSSSAEATVKRMAAFHFGETSPDAWMQLPERERFAWYYDKTHALIDQHSGLFPECLAVSTEDLSSEEFRRALSRWVMGDDAPVPKPMHLNAHAIDIAAVPAEFRDKVFWLLSRLNMHDLCKDDVYAVDYFLNKYVAWTGYQIRNAPQLGTSPRPSRDEIGNDLSRAHAILSAALREVEGLAKLNRDGE